MKSKVDAFVENSKLWSSVLNRLRICILKCGLEEEFKWRAPCYTYNGKNILLLGLFKEHCALIFLKGALLSDEFKILSAPGEDSNSVRVLKFKNTEEVISIETTLRKYIYEAVEIEKAGLKILPKKVVKSDFPAELTAYFNKDILFKEAFCNLTPGRQRGYILHFKSAKQPKTRTARIEKYRPRILKGKGFHDCVCGLSHKMPRCDGSHNKL